MEVPNGARAALAVLMKSMYLACSIFSLDSSDLVEGHEVDSEESLVEAADMVITASLYSLR